MISVNALSVHRLASTRRRPARPAGARTTLAQKVSS